MTIPDDPNSTNRLGARSIMLVLLATLGSSNAFSLSPEPTPDSQLQRRTPVVEVFESARDAVVNIHSTQIIEVRSPLGFDSLFLDLFDFGPTRRYQRAGMGSGFVLHPDGYIVTNAHVVARTAEREAIFASGENYDASIVAIDVEHDLAVLKIQTPQPLPTLTLGTSVDLMVGETVIAIGNPLGYQHTVTAGVVSALNRSLPIDERRNFEGLIQTDASINPGNSGGPLLNILGEAVGINTAIRADAENIGFAISVDQLRELLPVMLDVERRYRIRTGLRIEDASEGCRIVQAQPPAEQVGLSVNDVIRSINGTAIHSAIDFHIALVGKTPGETLNIMTVTGNQHQLILEPRARPDGSKLLLEKFGIEAEPITSGTAKRLRLKRIRGLVVTRIEQDGPADRIDLRPGDLLIQIGRHLPEDLQQVGELLEQVVLGDRIEVSFIRSSRFGLVRTTTVIRSR